MPSYTFLQIQTRVSAEVNDASNASVTLTQVKAAIVSAIEHYERQRAWFNETITTSIVTVAGTNNVAAPTDLVLLDKLQVTVGSSKYNLRPIDYDDFAEISGTSTTSGQPSDFAYYQDKFYLFPTPGAIYTITASYVKRLTTLSADADTNGWTNYAEPLIRNRAKWDIFTNLLFLPSLAATAKAQEMDALAEFDIERAQRIGSDRIRASYL